MVYNAGMLKSALYTIFLLALGGSAAVPESEVDAMLKLATSELEPECLFLGASGEDKYTDAQVQELSDSVRVLSYKKQGAHTRSASHYYALLQQQAGEWMPVTRLVLSPCFDNIAAFRLQGNVVSYYNGANLWLGDMALDNTLPPAPDYVQLRYLGRTDGKKSALKVELCNKLDCRVRLLPGRMCAIVLLPDGTLHREGYAAAVEEEIVLQPHEVKLCELPPYDHDGNTDWHKVPADSVKLTYMGFEEQTMLPPAADEWVPTELGVPGLPMPGGLPLADVIAMRYTWHPGYTSGVDSSTRTVLLYRFADGRWHEFERFTDTASGCARFGAQPGVLKMVGNELQMHYSRFFGPGRGKQDVCVGIVVPELAESRELVYMGYPVDISACMRQAPSQWEIIGGNFRLSLRVSALLTPAGVPLPVVQIPAPGGQTYHVLGWGRFVLNDENGDGVPDLVLHHFSSGTLYGVAGAAPCFSSPAQAAREQLSLCGYSVPALFGAEELEALVRKKDMQLLHLYAMGEIAYCSVPNQADLTVAIEGGHAECLELLMQAAEIKNPQYWQYYYTRKNPKVKEDGVWGYRDVSDMECTDTLLHTAVRCNSPACLQVLLRHPHPPFNSTDADGLTPFQLAEKLGHAECAQLLQEVDENGDYVE